MTMDYKDRQSVVSFQDTLKAEGVSDSFWLVHCGGVMAIVTNLQRI